MTIPLTGSQSLFVRIGHQGGLLNLINTNMSGTFITGQNAIRADYATTDQVIVDLLITMGQAWQTGQTGYTNYLNTIAENTLIQMVEDDTNLNNLTLTTALQELIRQMGVSSSSVNQPTVSGAVTYGNGVITNNGTGKAVVSVLNGQAIQEDYIYAENIYLTCSKDSQTGGATFGEEPFAITAELLDTIPVFYTWPIGSGATGTVSCSTAADSQDVNGNLLNNSGFEVFTANTPNNWVATAGTAGTDFQAGGSVNAYTGVNCLEVIGTSTEVTIKQQFNNVAGTTAQPSPETPYLLSFWVKTSATPAAGAITVSLVNGSGSVIQDDQGNNNSAVFSLTAVSTTYLNKTAVFRLPRALPSTIYLKVDESTDITAGKNFFIDEMTLQEMTQLYSGGPFVAIVTGSVPWLKGDVINLAMSNNYGGAFQSLFERFFDMSSLGLIIPSSVSPTISDSLVTT